MSLRQMNIYFCILDTEWIKVGMSGISPRSAIATRQSRNITLITRPITSQINLMYGTQNSKDFWFSSTGFASTWPIVIICTTSTFKLNSNTCKRLHKLKAGRIYTTSESSITWAFTASKCKIYSRYLDMLQNSKTLPLYNLRKNIN